MIKTIQRLRIFVDQTLNASSLAGRELTNIELDAWHHFIMEQKKSLEIHFEMEQCACQKKLKNDISGIAELITKINNKVYSNFLAYTRLSKGRKCSTEVRKEYLLTCRALDEVVNSLVDLYPGKVTVSFPDFKFVETTLRFNEKLGHLKSCLSSWQIPSELSEILVTAIRQHSRKKSAKRTEIERLFHAIDHLTAQKSLDSTGLLDQLIILNFNLPEVFLYAVSKWKDILEELPGLHEQIDFLISERQRLADLINEILQLRQDPTLQLYFELQGYLLEKQNFVKETLENRKSTLIAIEHTSSISRFLINLPVPQFGLLIRMLIEKGILPKEKLGELFRFFAVHFYTSNASQMSPESLRKKSSDVEFSTAMKMKGILIGMVNWLNTNYNLSNYN